MKKLAALAALALVAFPSTGSAATLSEYATSITGQPVTVHCQAMTGDEADDLGFTWQTSDADGTTTMAPDIYLAPALCYSISRATSGKRTNPYTLGTALEVLTHEATHIRLNSGDESVVACNAILRIDRTIRLLGLGAQLRKLHATAWDSYWASPDEYLLDPVCRAHPHEGYAVIGPVQPPQVHVMLKP